MARLTPGLGLVSLVLGEQALTLGRGGHRAVPDVVVAVTAQAVDMARHDSLR